jgi:TonB family protein
VSLARPLHNKESDFVRSVASPGVILDKLLMYIDFEDYRPDTPRVEGALSVREGVLVSIIVHLLLFIGILFLPDLSSNSANSPLAQRMAQRTEESPRFVFMQPRADISKPQPKPNVEASDQDRVASSRERAPNPKNALPFVRGNSPERTEAEPAKPAEPADHSADAAAPGHQNQSEEGQTASNDPPRSTLRLPDKPSATPPALSMGGRSGSNGVLGDAIRNLQRYTQQQSFDNPQGSGDGQGLIQFDSKGVEFGPWLRRFVAQVKRNWFIPSAAMMMKGHVVITFNVHKDGSITDIDVKGPSGIEAFDRAAANALVGSNPTQPLPPEYPSDKAFFTVTFLYNETPPGQYGQ